MNNKQLIKPTVLKNKLKKYTTTIVSIKLLSELPLLENVEKKSL